MKVSSPHLAVNGGTPVRPTLLPYGRQTILEEDIAAVVEVLRSDWLTTGPKVQEFEETFASHVGAKHAVTFSSGTAALHGAIFAAGIGSGDEVITSPLTFCASANCVLYQQGTPVFADILPDTMTIDPDRFRASITSRTKAIIPVDFAGHPADLDAISEIAERHGLLVIEDAAHALGALYRGRQVGSVAAMTMFSLHPVKHVTTGEGGVITTSSETLARRLRQFRSHGIDSDPRLRHERGQWLYDMSELGYNYRLTDIACALGMRQLGRLNQNLQRRREIAARYRQAFSDMPELLLPSEHSDCSSAWHLYPVRVAGNIDRVEAFRALRAENIGVNVHYIPVHMHSFYRRTFGYQGGEFPVAEKAYAGLISLPMFHGMTDRDTEDVIEAVRKVLPALAA